MHDETIIDAMARALFCSSWATWAEENGINLSMCNIMDVAPPTPQAARDSALVLYGTFEGLNEKSLFELLREAYQADNPGVTENVHDEITDDYSRKFGHYLAMGALGHGVSWFDDHERFPIRFPTYWEFDAESECSIDELDPHGERHNLADENRIIDERGCSRMVARTYMRP